MRTEKNEASKNFGEIETKRGDDKTTRFEVSRSKNPVKPEDEITDEQIAAVSEEVISQIKEMIMEKYNITEEQLNVVMNNLGMDSENLLDMATLTQLVMKLEGVETQGDMLTNPDFAKNLKDILSKAEEIKNTVKLEDIEIEKMLEGVTEVEEKVVKEVTDDVAVVEDEIVSEETAETSNVDTVETETTLMTDKNLTEENNDSSGLMKHDNSDKNTSDVKSVNENNMINAQEFARKLTEDLSGKVGETKANDIVRQVVEQTQLHVKQGVTSLEMQLYPEHLGKVLVQVVTHDGNITAQITAESEAAKSALESQLTLLKENLNNQGLKIENVEVTIASHAFEQNMQGETHDENGSAQSKKSRRNTDMFFDEVSDEQVDETDKGIMELKGSTVSYSA